MTIIIAIIVGYFIGATVHSLLLVGLYNHENSREEARLKDVVETAKKYQVTFKDALELMSIK